MSDCFVTVDGVRLNVIDEGEGSAVLALHGFTGDASTMSEAVDGIETFARAVRLDFVGHGRSDRPFELAPYTMPACVRHVLGVTKALALERPHLVGYSMGGRTALAAAADSTSDFRSLTLVGATAGIEDPAAREQRVRADAALADRIERDGIEPFVNEWMALPLFKSQRRLGERALSRARAQRLSNQPHALAQSLRGMGAGAQTPLYDQLDSVELPVLLVVGEEDQKFRDIAEDLEFRLPNARRVIVPNAGHAVHLEAPDAFRAVFFDFLREVDTSLPGGQKGKL